MAETQQDSIADLLSQARKRLTQQLQEQAAELHKLEQSVQALRGRQQQLEVAIQQQLEALGRLESPLAPPPAAASLEKLLAAVRDLITATLPEQVLDVLTEEAEQLEVRAAVFDVRGKAAWGSSARGFGPGLSEKVFRGLVVPLSQDNPFRVCYETGGHVDASVELLKRNRNVLEKLRPNPADPILLLPIRSAGSVSAIFYADAGGRRKELPVDALKILAEFAGAQLDRLMAFSGGLPAEAVRAEPGAVEAVPEPVGEAAVTPVEPWATPAGAEMGEAPGVAEAPPAVVVESAPVAEEAAPAPPAVAAGLDLAQLSEADQKVHRDAKRFARLLISEIELYNKAKVADGRKNRDLYRRLKSDIDRSRQTYEKRFGRTVAMQFDYFHEELVKTLGSSDPSLLGSDYPGPSV